MTRRATDGAYLEVRNSSTFCQFGEMELAKTGPRSGIEKRYFYHLEDEPIKDRAKEVFAKVIQGALV